MSWVTPLLPDDDEEESETVSYSLPSPLPRSDQRSDMEQDPFQMQLPYMGRMVSVVEK